MTLTAPQEGFDLVTFDERRRELARRHPALEAARRDAIQRFARRGFPTGREEEWRFTNLHALASTTFVPPDGTDERAAADAVRQFGFAAEAAAELVFVNGRYAPGLSRTRKLSRGISVSTLMGDGRMMDDYLMRPSSSDQFRFAALNTGLFEDAALVRIGRGVAVDGPIHLLFLSMPGGRPTVSHPRTLIVLEEGSSASVVETYAGIGNTYWTNAVTEIRVGESASLDHCKLQQEAGDAFHISNTAVTLERSAQLISHAAFIGGRLTRNDVRVELVGERADATLNGLVILSGEQHCDNHTLLHHRAPNCPSHELFKHVLGGRATGVFKGQILVDRAAQKTDSKQTSKSLLLSDTAAMNSMPALEIYADDVKCTHGSTTGPVDEDMVFYLRSRGVSLDAARHLLTYAFAADITRRIRIEPVRSRIEDFMANQHGLPRDLRIADTGTHDEAAL